jgi:hypothetical protein
MKLPKNRQHGGKRSGAGRPKTKKKSSIYADSSTAALQYLSDVAAGKVKPNRDRISAAKSLLPYQESRKRAPVKSPAPSQLQAKTDFSQQREAKGNWDRKVIEIKSRFARKD